MLKVDIKALPKGVTLREVSPSAEEISVDPNRFDDIEVDLRLEFNGRRLFVTSNVSATATLECDRTLVLFDRKITGSFTLLFVPPDEIDPDNDQDDMLPLEESDEEIDLTNIVRDTLLLAVPARNIAPGAEEAVLPTSFGEPDESDVDPRWKELEKFRSDDDASDAR